MLEFRTVRPARFAAVMLLPLALLATHAAPAQADGKSRFTALEENDSLYFNSDKHYTQGLRFSYLAPNIAHASGWNAPFDWIGAATPVFQAPGPADRRRYSFFLGQSIFTPKNVVEIPPSRSDRPYAGWLYGGLSLLQETGGRMLENLEVDLGVVGPGSYGKQVQNDWHQLIGKSPALGWSSQIQHEIGGLISYERLWRVPLIGGGGNGVDVVPMIGATLGNVFTYGEAGGLLRIGKNLRADYGPVRIRPALSGTDYFNGDALDGDFGFYIFAGAQGRVVGRNIFLDGNSFRASPNIAKKTFVADLQAGFSIFWSTAFRVDFSMVRRTEEFVGQHTPDEIGTASLSFSW